MSMHRSSLVYRFKNYVRDEILFGYNTDDSIPASKVLADGLGRHLKNRNVRRIRND